MEADTAAKDDIEDCSETECDTAAMSTTPAAIPPAGVAGRFASYIEARQAEVDQHHGTGQNPVKSDTSGSLDLSENRHEVVETFESQLNDWLGAPAKAQDRECAEEETLKPGDELEEFGAQLNHDGSFTGGPAAGGSLDDFKIFLNEDADTSLPTLAGDSHDGAKMQQATAAVEESDGSDAEDHVVQGAAEEALPDEAWKDRPTAERELWERVRPRAVRREAGRVKDLKLPVTSLNRLMRVHPDLQTKSSEAVEIINYATVLLLQAITQATVRGRKAAGQTVRLEDLKQVCLQNRELHFLLPLSATLDASALSISRHDADDAQEEAAKTRVQAPAAPGQSTLSSATFARTAASSSKPQEEAVADDAEGLDVVTVQGNLEPKDSTLKEKPSNKRKLPPSTKKVTHKVPRQCKATPEKEKAPAGPGIASFFKRAESTS